MDARPDDVESEQAGVKSLLRKVQLILEAFGPDDEHLGLTEISRRSGVAKATVHRLSQELLAWGVLERRGSDYRLGMRLFEIGQRVPRQRILRDAAHPYMEELYVVTKQAIHLAIRDGIEVLYLEKIYGHGSTAKPSRVAGRMPLHSTATGRVLLAHAPRSVVEEVLSSPLARVTRHTVAVPGLILQELARVRELGYAEEFEQTRLGYSSVAVPIYGTGASVIGALAITAPAYRADVAKFVRLLRDATRKVTKALTDASEP